MLVNRASLGLLIASATGTYCIVVPTLNTLDTASPASSGLPSTITAPARLPYSGQAIPINTCSYYNSTISQYQWNDPWCSIKAGTVQLTYWPTSDNKSYPATIYNSQLDYTFSSPSVYMVINTVYGWNRCGPLGPTSSNAVFAFDITDVFTLVPYTDMAATTRRSTRQLDLSDLGTHCTSAYNISSIQTLTHPLKNDADRCNPNMIIPHAIKLYGLPYWNHCGNVGNKFGLFDPPYAVPPLEGLLAPATPSANSEVPAGTHGPSIKATISPDLASATVASTVASTATPATSSSSPPADTSYGAAATRSQSPVVVDTTRPAHNEGPDAPPRVTQTGPSSVARAVTVDQQVVSLGPAGLEVVDTAGGETLTYVVPALGATETGSSVAPASAAVYQGWTLTRGGPGVTVTGVVVLLPSATGSSSELSSSTPPAVTASAPRVTGGVFSLVLGVLAAWVCSS